MIEFLKNLFGNEKSPAQKQRDVIVLDAYGADDEEEQQPGGCGTSGNGGGCGPCGCR